jgi:acyl carrier protein
LIFGNVLYTEDEIKKKIKNIFFEVFPKLSENDFQWEKEQKDYENWDSFAQLNIITITESNFDIEFSLEESIEIKSPSDLLELVKTHLK